MRDLAELDFSKASEAEMTENLAERQRRYEEQRAEFRHAVGAPVNRRQRRAAAARARRA